MPPTVRYLGMICFGNMLEWYDFGIFMAIIPFIMPQFFAQNTSSAISLVFGYAILAASYLARPLGGLLLGYWGDTYGKARIFKLTLLLISFPSIGIALLPTYATIGVLAPVSLLLLRLVQGFSVGGECMNAVILSYECVSNPWRNLATILTWMSSGFGLLLGSGLIFLLQHLFGQAQFKVGVWRIAFLIGGLLGIIAIYTRRYAAVFLETNLSQVNKTKSTLMGILQKNSQQLFYLVVLFIPIASMFYLLFFYMPSYIQAFAPWHSSQQFCLLLVLQIMPIIITYLLPVANWKHIAHQSLFLFMLLLFPAYDLILGKGSLFWLGQYLLIIPVALYAVAAMLHAFEIAALSVRFTLLAFSFNLSYAIFGNLVPLIVTYWTLKLHQPLLPIVYLFMLAAITSMVLWLFPLIKKNRYAIQISEPR